jgi:hypothetical protein
MGLKKKNSQKSKSTVEDAVDDDFFEQDNAWDAMRDDEEEEKQKSPSPVKHKFKSDRTEIPQIKEVNREKSNDSDDEDEVKFDDDDEMENGLFDTTMYNSEMMNENQDEPILKTAGTTNEQMDIDKEEEDVEDSVSEKTKKTERGPSIKALKQEKFVTKLKQKRAEFEAGTKPKLNTLIDGLGKLNGKIFYHSHDCVERLQLLRDTVENDDENRTVWRQLAEWKLLQKELMNIIACNRRYSDNDEDSDNQDLLFETVSLMVTLTDPPKKLSDLNQTSHKRIPKKMDQSYLKDQYRVLQEMKLGFLQRDSVASLMETLLPSDNNAENNNFLLEREQSSKVLTYEEYTMLVVQLLVNLLKIPDAPRNVLSATDQLSQMQEMFIKQLSRTQMFKFINAVIQKLFVKFDTKASSNLFIRKQVVEWYLLCLEFICLITMDETPEALFEAERSLSKPVQRAVASASTTNTSNGTNRAPRVVAKASDFDQALLKRLVEAEADQTKSQSSGALPRHSRFSGYFVTRLKDPIDDIIQDSNTEDTPLQKAKKQVHTNSVKITRKVNTGSNPLSGTDTVVNQRQLCVREKLRNPSFSWLTTSSKKLLKDFLNIFFKHSFNTFFERIWDCINLHKKDSGVVTDNMQDGKLSGGTRNSDSNYEAMLLYLSGFMLEYNRQNYYHHIELNKRLVSLYTKEAKYDISSIASVVASPEVVNYVLDRYVDKSYEIKDWSALTQISYFLKEVMMCIEMMFQVNEYTQIASTLLHKLLYEPRRVYIIPRMIRLFQPNQFPRRYLVNMVELSHVLLRIMEQNEKNGYDNFFIKKKKVNRRKKGDPAKKPEQEQKVDQYEYHDEDEEQEEEQENVPVSYDQQNQFELKSFKKKFANRAIVAPYMLLLEDFMLNSVKLNECILEMINMIADKNQCDMKLLLFNVLTLAFFSKVLAKKNSLYPSEKSVLMMTERERMNKKLVDTILNLVREWRTIILNDSVFAKHLHVEAWFQKTSKGIDILKGNETDSEERVYSDRERKNKRQSKRTKGLGSEIHSDGEDMGHTDAGEDVPEEDMDLDDRPTYNFSMEEGEEEFQFEQQQPSSQQESQQSDEEDEDTTTSKKKKKKTDKKSKKSKKSKKNKKTTKKQKLDKKRTRSDLEDEEEEEQSESSDKENEAPETPVVKRRRGDSRRKSRDTITIEGTINSTV